MDEKESKKKQFMFRAIRYYEKMGMANRKPSKLFYAKCSAAGFVLGTIFEGYAQHAL